MSLVVLDHLLSDEEKRYWNAVNKGLYGAELEGIAKQLAPSHSSLGSSMETISMLMHDTLHMAQFQWQSLFKG